jgi:hypothetical protein
VFIYEVANLINTRIQPAPESVTFSKPKQTFGSWFRQKKRHLTTGGFYRPSHKIVLGLFSLSQLVFFGSLIALAILKVDWMLLLGMYILRLITQAVIIKKSMNRRGEKNFLLLFPFFEVFLMMINLLLGFTGLFSRKTQW